MGPSVDVATKELIPHSERSAVALASPSGQVGDRVQLVGNDPAAHAIVKVAE